MKICFISGVKFGHELLSHMLENNLNISIIFSYADSKKTNYSDFIAFDDIAMKYGIKHVKVNNINDLENVKIINDIHPDLILVMGWSQLLKKEILNVPKLGTIGSHPTELPKYRGRAPIPWTIIKGLNESALTFFYITEGTDEGDIVNQHNFRITPNDDTHSLYEKIIVIGKQMIMETIQLLEQNKIKRIPQDNSKFIEYWIKRTPEDGKINWANSAKEIHTLIRGTTHPYPGAFTYYKKSKLVIWQAEYTQNDTNKLPGEILDVSKQGLKVSTGMGYVLLQKISLNDGEEKNPYNIFSKNDLGVILGE